WRPGSREAEGESSELATSSEAVLRVIELLVEIEAWTQTVDDDEERLDDARARVRIEAGGHRATAWEWQNDLQSHNRLVRVREMLEGLARQGLPAAANLASEPPT